MRRESQQVEKLPKGIGKRFITRSDILDWRSLPLLSLAGAGSPAPKSVVDVGCGIGGSSRYLSRKFGAKVTGITLSPVQAARAGALARQQGLADKVRTTV